MNQVEKSVPLTIAGRNKLTTQIRSYLLVVLLCMYRVIRPDYEVVKVTCFSAQILLTCRYLFIFIHQNQIKGKQA
jgi:hypothetical protein